MVNTIIPERLLHILYKYVVQFAVKQLSWFQSVVNEIGWFQGALYPLHSPFIQRNEA